MIEFRKVINSSILGLFQPYTDTKILVSIPTALLVILVVRPIDLIDGIAIYILSVVGIQLLLLVGDLAVIPMYALFLYIRLRLLPNSHQENYVSVTYIDIFRHLLKIQNVSDSLVQDLLRRQYINDNTEPITVVNWSSNTDFSTIFATGFIGLQYGTVEFSAVDSVADSLDPQTMSSGDNAVGVHCYSCHRQCLCRGWFVKSNEEGRNYRLYLCSNCVEYALSDLPPEIEEDARSFAFAETI